MFSKPHWNAFKTSGTIRDFVAVLPLIGVISLPLATLVFNIIDHIDGIFSGNGFGRSPNWRRYRLWDYGFDLVGYSLIIIGALWLGIWNIWHPFLFLLLALHPVMTGLRWKYTSSGIGQFAVPNGVFLFFIAVASLIGASTVVLGLLALGLFSPLVETWVHSPDWNITDDRVALYSGLASSLWLGVGVLSTGFWSWWVPLLPVVVVIIVENVGIPR